MTDQSETTDHGPVSAWTRAWAAEHEQEFAELADAAPKWMPTPAVSEEALRELRRQRQLEVTGSGIHLQAAQRRVADMVYIHELVAAHVRILDAARLTWWERVERRLRR